MSTPTYFKAKDVESLHAELVNYALTNGYTFSNGCQLNPANKNAAQSLATILDWMTYALVSDHGYSEEIAKQKAREMFVEVFKTSVRLKLYKEWRQLSWWALRVIDDSMGQELTIEKAPENETEEEKAARKETWEEWMARHGFEVKKKKGAQPRPVPAPEPEPEPVPAPAPRPEDSGTPEEFADSKTLLGFIWRIIKYAMSKVVMEEDDGEVISALLMGPAGVGKTYSIKHVAKKFGAKVFVITAGQRVTDYLGYTDAQGMYHPSPMIEAIRYAQDHSDQLVVILFDELDMTPADVSGVLFSLFASREIETLHVTEKCPKNVALFAAMNTMGDGANDDFAGRTPVDKAMLDRFAFPYCAMFEEATARRLCKDDRLVNLILDWNQACMSTHLTKAVLSYRTMNAFRMAVNAGFDLEYAVGKIVMGQTRDTLDTIWDAMRDHRTKYPLILKDCIAAVPMDR